MKYSLLIVALAAFLPSCKDTAQKTPVEGCYSYVYDKDSVSLHIDYAEDHRISGSLMFHFFEKDRNKGTITGVMKGDTLYATYTFMSEGKQSFRAVVFLKKGETFTEGYGKINDTTGEPDLSDRSAIHFEGKMILKKTDCPDNKPL